MKALPTVGSNTGKMIKKKTTTENVHKVAQGLIHIFMNMYEYGCIGCIDA